MLVLVHPAKDNISSIIQKFSRTDRAMCACFDMSKSSLSMSASDVIICANMKT
ncbi:hypothetical protein ACP70R_041281 [Stipagrostis hirtigluma subsp. patula]